jgi:hypothetical protein
MPRAEYYAKHAEELKQKERERYQQSRGQTQTTEPKTEVPWAGELVNIVKRQGQTRTIRPTTRLREFSCIYCDDHLSPYSKVDFIFHLKAMHGFSHEEAVELVKELSKSDGET